MATTYTVKRGDTLWAIANTYSTTVNNLVQLNNISNPDYIVVGQVLRITADTPAPTPAKNSSVTSRATINIFGLQSNTDRTMYATWVWDVSNTEEYQVTWLYDTGDGVWFIGSDTTTNDKQNLYTAPSNAKSVKFKVKPISKTRMVNDVETVYWTAAWSTEKSYDFSNNPPITPSVPSIKIEKYKLTTELDNLDVNATEIQFQIVKDDSIVFNTGTAKIITNHASYSCAVDAGGEYKVRCRSVRGNKYSEWSTYSTKASTIPNTPSDITSIKASSETSVYLSWNASNMATSYDIEYTTKMNYFDGSDQTTVISSIEGTHYEKTGLSGGVEYFFRIRSKNEHGESGWSGVKSVVVGSTPAAPTTWSSTTTVITGEELILYWVHNSVDGSSQTYGEVEVYINGVKQTYTVKNTEVEADKDKTSFYKINTSTYKEGTTIQWRVRTAGVTKNYGDWSTQRTIDVYAPPTLALSVKDKSNELIETLTSFPFYVYALPGPKTQSPISYHILITSKNSYETVDSIGNIKMVNAGEEVYSKHFETSDVLLIELSPSNIDLQNNARYKVTVTVSMNSGLTSSASSEFKVLWTDEVLEPNAEVGVDMKNLTAHIRPYCEDVDGNLVEDITLSVYRREFDGAFTEIATDIKNRNLTFVTDPHPSLDFARYRIVAITNSTGAVSYYDIQGYPVGEKSVIIQWDEKWSNFDISEDEIPEEPAWSGSLLKLPYNIDISDNHASEVSLVKYSGRKRPVSYYGTQLGETATWSVDIIKGDKETLYSLRRLAIWMGDVYIREPSGSGYWANISVSFSQTHNELTIPVTISVTRVEGGV